MTNPAQPDKTAAKRFLALLGRGAESFTFQTFDDNKHRKAQTLARILHGTLEEHFDALADLNGRGAGVFVTVNETDGRGRKLENMTRARAIFQEADRPGTPPPPLVPHISVESSPGKFHRYLLIDPATTPTWDEWRSVMRRMVQEYGSDPNAQDPARVLRLPGFFHQKDPSNPHMVRIVTTSDIPPYTWETIVAAIPPLAEELPDKDTLRQTPGTGIKEPLRVRSALASLDPDMEYEGWLKVGMGLHHATSGGGDGFELWDEWSSNGTSYRPGECAAKWRSFGRYSGRMVTLSTVFEMAAEAGWNWETARLGVLPQARQTVERVIEESKENPKAYLTPESIEAFSVIRAIDPLEYEQLRTDLKRANRLIRVGALDDFVGVIAAETSDKDESVATQLVELAKDRCTLWHDADGNPYASFERETDGRTHTEHWRVDSSGFREWLSWLAHSEMETAPPSEAIKATCNALAGQAKFDGEEHTAFRRMAKTEEGYWLDLCDEHWRAILVTAAGWRIVDTPPVRFIRTKAMRPLPTPVDGGRVDDLWALTNIPEEDRPLALAWVLESYRGDTPYPVLEFIGEQGSAKSTTQETLRAFIDPNKVMLRGRPKTVEDVFVAAGNNHVISLENLSGITPEISDALCTVATGGGVAGRQLFTNDEENIIEAHNPVMLNGIGAVITRPDLLDRAVAVCLPTIEQRMTEGEHAARLAEKAPSIMGALLDLFSATLAELPSVHIPPEDLPRMADFAHLGEAMHRAMGGKPGEWLALYVSHRRDAIQRTIDASPVAMVCKEFVDKGKEYRGTVKGLREKLNELVLDMPIERGDYWPRSPKGMGDALRRAAPALRQLGVHLKVDNKPRRDGVHCTLCPDWLS